MALRTKTRPYWTCRRCGYRNLRANVNCRGEQFVACPWCETRGHVVDECQNCNGKGRVAVPCEAKRPKKRVAAHARVIQGDTYPLFVEAAWKIHGVTDESCCVCGKPRSQERRHDRDHDHRTGKPRGLACPGNTGCNVRMLPWINSRVALVVSLEMRASGEAQEAKRWLLIHDYLQRVEVYYRERVE